MSHYLGEDWQKFFNIWDSSFSPEIRKNNEYKILSFKLRVHFAILPIRIIQLHQINNFGPNKSSKAYYILKNFAEKFNLVENTNMDLEEEENKLTYDSMKQLENFLNSESGFKLAEDLKDSPLRIFFALPYIVNPFEDESMKNIFTINWLDELITELENFIIKFSKSSDPNLNTFQNHSANKIDESQICNNSQINNNCNGIITENKKNSMSNNRAVNLTIKNKQVEDWIANHSDISENIHMETKGTQTEINNVHINNFPEMPKELENSNPDLNTFFDNSNNHYGNELSLTKSRLYSVHRHYKKLKMRFHQLHEDYEKMNEIAEELTLALENSVRGHPVNMDTILQTCMKIFPERFEREIQTDSEDTSLDIREDLSETNADTKKEFEAVNNILVSPETLDYKKIKFHLREESAITKLPLLQALRHKLTLNESEHRNKTIFEYTKNDILGLQENDINSYESILGNLLQEINFEDSYNLVQQTASRFLNAIASFYMGRTYLTSGPIVLNTIINYLNSCNKGTSDTVTLDMLIATLQKISLRKQQREYMIEANLVEWLLYHLNNEKLKMSTYRLEYICALLMNLSLQHDARSRASTLAPLYVSIMADLLNTDCTSIFPYLNGALQNFLSNNEINNEAKRINLGKILEYHFMNCSKELRPHFSQTIKIYKRERNENLSDDEFPDDDNDTFDIVEKELEQKDPLTAKLGDFHGENLLAQQYCISNFSLDSKKIFVKRIDDMTPLRNTNLYLRESKKSGLNASMINAASETTLDDFKTETTEKKSGTVGLARTKKFSTGKDEEKLLFKKNENPFLAKPRILRTPPCSARSDSNQVNKFKRFRKKMK